MYGVQITTRGDLLDCAREGEFDPTELTVSRISDEATNDRLQPYLVNGVLVFLVEGLMTAAAVGLVVGTRKAAGARKPLEAEHARLLEKLAALKTKRARLAGANEPSRYAQPLG
jgi:hypothetical protein